MRSLREQLAHLSAPPQSVQTCTAAQSGFNPGWIAQQTGAVGTAVPGGQRRPLTCYGCGQPGHIRSRCPWVANPANADGVSGTQPGYHAKRLRKHHPRRRRRKDDRYHLEVGIDGTKRVVVVDTGCERTIVPPNATQGHELGPTDSRLLGVGGREVPVLGIVKLEVQLGETKRVLECLVSDSTDEIVLGLDWLKSSEARWQFGQKAITVGGCRYPLSSSADFGETRPRGARVRACRVDEPRSPEVVPLMTIVFEKEYAMPTWMEPPRRQRRPVERKVEPSGEVSLNETESHVESSGVAEVTTRLVPAIIGPSPSVVELAHRPEGARIVPPDAESCRQPAREKFGRG